MHIDILSVAVANLARSEHKVKPGVGAAMECKGEEIDWS